MPRRKPIPFVVAKVTANGSISVPAPLRNRWGADRLRVEDHGGYAVLRPVDGDEDGEEATD